MSGEQCEKMARLIKLNSFTLFKVFLVLCLVWFLLNYYSSYLSSSEHLRIPYHRLVNSQGIDRKTAEILQVIKGAKKLAPKFDGGCEPAGISVPFNSNLDNVSCKRVPPTAEACSVIKKLFGKFEIETCDKDVNKYDICEIKEISVADFHVHCHQKLCKGIIELGLINKTNGDLEWIKFTSASKLEDRIAEIIHPTYDKKHFGFSFVRCDPVQPVGHVRHVQNYDDYDDDYMYMDSNLAVQLLVFPPQVKIKPKKIQTTGEKAPIDINLILLDSVSRHHFYRSLPNVLKTFEQINKQPVHKAKVFDYKLFQTIKARTYESINALFAGFVDLKEKPFGIYDKPHRPLAYETTLKPLKKNGYKTLVLEDLCWTWEWGIPKDLLVLNKSSTSADTWYRLNKAFENAGIDDTDISLASCEILKANGQKDPFHHLPKICFNGHHMNEYFLDYLHRYQTKLSLGRENFLTYYANDDGHDEWGLRVRTLDVPLANYIKNSLQNQNMLTVIFSDHGNSYGSFVENTFEGRLELYHASLFIIIPDGVRHKLGSEKMAALATNQNRLISMLDVHYTIQSLIPNHNPVIHAEHESFLLNHAGLFSVVTPNRTCINMPHLHPHLCICQGYESPLANNSANAIVAEFALGSLNNIIQAQLYQANPSAVRGFGACQRLVAQSFTNVREGNEPDGSIVTRLDLRVGFTEPDGRRTEAVFLTTIASSVGGKDGMKLVSFSRMTKYGRFAQCADKGVLLTLCVCSLHQPKPDLSVPIFFNSSAINWPRILQTETETYPVDKSNCLFLLIRRYKVGASFDATNICKKRWYRMVLALKTSNLDSSHSLPVVTVIEPGGYKFVTVVRQRALNRSWNWSYRIQYGFLDV